jgi:hypothetical protein
VVAAAACAAASDGNATLNRVLEELWPTPDVRGNKKAPNPTPYNLQRFTKRFTKLLTKQFTQNECQAGAQSIRQVPYPHIPILSSDYGDPIINRTVPLAS